MKNSVHELPTSNKEKIIIFANKGQTFSIKIRGNKTTGYSWFLLNPEKLDKETIEPLNLNEHNTTTNYQMDENPNHLSGVGGFFYFDFKIPENAETQMLELSFVHKRPWEDQQTVHIAQVSITGVKKEL